MNKEKLISTFNQVRSTRIFSILILLGSWFVLYQIYDWVKTESTDNAYVEADISSVSSEINGVISEVLVQENTIVEQGQIIAKINQEEFTTKFGKATAALKGAEHDIQSIEGNIRLAQIEKERAKEEFEFAEASYKVAQSEFNRVKALQKENFASVQKLDNAEIAFEKAKNAFSQSKLNMEIANEKLALLETQKLSAEAKVAGAAQENKEAERALKNTVIISPIGGMIGNSFIRVGNYVRAGVPLFSVVPIDKLYVKANFKETQIEKFKPGMNAAFTIDSFPGVKFKGKLRNISPATGAKFSLLPPANATGNFTKIVQRVPVLIDFEVPDELKGKIVPGMSTIVKVRID